MHPQLAIALSQAHQQELRRAAREARADSRPRAQGTRSRRLNLTFRTPRTAPAITPRVGTV